MQYPRYSAAGEYYTHSGYLRQRLAGVARLRRALGPRQVDEVDDAPLGDLLYGGRALTGYSRGTHRVLKGFSRTLDWILKGYLGATPGADLESVDVAAELLLLLDDDLEDRVRARRARIHRLHPQWHVYACACVCVRSRVLWGTLGVL